MGDPETGLEALKAISPVYYIGKLRDALFVSFGEEDDRIDFQQSADLIRQLREHRKRFTHIMAKDAGHNLGADEMEIKVFTELERFLRQHFPP